MSAHVRGELSRVGSAHAARFAEPSPELSRLVVRPDTGGFRPFRRTRTGDIILYSYGLAAGTVVAAAGGYGVYRLAAGGDSGSPGGLGSGSVVISMIVYGAAVGGTGVAVYSGYRLVRLIRGDE